MTTLFNLQTHPHRRLNPLTGEWVLVSPHRTERPWQGQVEAAAPEVVPEYDATCYMCPGNRRANGEQNPDYSSTFVFPNDFGALKETVPTGSFAEGELIAAHAERGVCRVVCFSPRHDLALAQMAVADVRRVVDVWIEQVQEVNQLPRIGYVQIFENRGPMMGASNPHPHGQIWATTYLPNEVAKELTRQQAYHEMHAGDLLGDYLEFELKSRERVVCENDSWVALVPFWATWPFETLVIPKRRVPALEALREAEREGLAEILKELTMRYDSLFGVPFPYSMGFHGRPNDGDPHPEWRLHAHFYPPLLRSATVRKFMVGFEMLAMPQRDLTPEYAADKLRAVKMQHEDTKGREEHERS